MTGHRILFNVLRRLVVKEETFVPATIDEVVPLTLLIFTSTHISCIVSGRALSGSKSRPTVVSVEIRTIDETVVCNVGT